MKKSLQIFGFVFLVCFAFVNAGHAQLASRKASKISFAPTEKAVDGSWIHWDNGANSDAIGLTEAGTFYVASRWEPADIASYDNMYINRIRVYIQDPATTTTLKIWQGSDVSTLVEYVSIPFSQAADSWVNVILEVPYQIDGSKELWFGYEVQDPGAGVYTAGLDNSTAHSGKGNLVKLGATGEWVALLQYGFAGNWNIQAFVSESGNPDAFSVTFNVNMGGAEGFDKEVHKVYVTGNFTEPERAEPGQEGSVELYFDPDASYGPDVLYFEGFENWNTGNPGALPSGWIQKRTASLTDDPTNEAADPKWLLNNPDSNPFGVDPPNPNAWKTYVKNGQGSLVIGYTAPEFTWAISPEIIIPEASEIKLSYWEWYDNYADNVWFTNYHVLVFANGQWTLLKSFIGTEGVPSNLFETAVEIDLDAYGDKTIQLAFVYEYNDGFEMAIDDIRITGFPAENNSEKLIFTATVSDIPPGLLEYKYYSDAFGQGFGGAEWPGDPDRLAWVDKMLVLNDVWNNYVHDPTVSTNEILASGHFKIYPNPVHNTLYIQSEQPIDYLRLFDMAGRLVFQAYVMDNQTTIDTARLGGGLYILQMVSGQQVKTHKIQVVK